MLGNKLEIVLKKYNINMPIGLFKDPTGTGRYICDAIIMGSLIEQLFGNDVSFKYTDGVLEFNDLYVIEKEKI